MYAQAVQSVRPVESTVGLTYPTGQQAAFMANIAVACGVDWYLSLLVIPNSKLNASCTWVDRDGSNGLCF
jgi:hypothetical protein